MSWFVTKNFPMTGAYVDPGNSATHPGQCGWYRTLQACL
jgi:hypothetical protein